MLVLKKNQLQNLSTTSEHKNPHKEYVLMKFTSADVLCLFNNHLECAPEMLFAVSLFAMKKPTIPQVYIYFRRILTFIDHK